MSLLRGNAGNITMTLVWDRKNTSTRIFVSSSLFGKLLADHLDWEVSSIKLFSMIRHAEN